MKTIGKGKPGAIDITSPKNGVIVLRETIVADSDPQLKVEHFTDPPRFARTAFIKDLQRAGVRMATVNTVCARLATQGEPKRG